MFCVYRHDIAHIGGDQYYRLPVRLVAVGPDPHKWGVFHLHHHFFVRGDQIVAVGILAKYR